MAACRMKFNRPLPEADRNQEMFNCTLSSFSIRGFPGGSVVKNLPAKQEMQETWVQSLGREGPWKEEMATRVSILAWENPMVR